MFAHAQFTLPDGSMAIATHGDLVGRLSTAAIHLDDARVSEAHAMVSLRGRELKLLALRGRFAVDGKTITEAILATGMSIEIAGGLCLEVNDVLLPDEVLSIQAEGIPRQVLGGVCSITARPRPRIHRRYLPDAAVHIWNIGTEWRIKREGQPPSPLMAGDNWIVNGIRFEAVPIPLDRVSQHETRLKGGIRAPIRLVAMYDSVHIHRENHVAIALGGISARILSELVSFGGPTDWELLAREIWRDPLNRHALRKKWDVNLSRLRSKLRAAKIRGDLIRADGTGKLELLLHDGDEVEDRT